MLMRCLLIYLVSGSRCMFSCIRRIWAVNVVRCMKTRIVRKLGAVGCFTGRGVHRPTETVLRKCRTHIWRAHQTQLVVVRAVTLINGSHCSDDVSQHFARSAQKRRWRVAVAAHSNCEMQAFLCHGMRPDTAKLYKAGTPFSDKAYVGQIGPAKQSQQI